MRHLNHSSENSIEVENVSFSYAGAPVLSGITLAIHKGDYLAIVGGNGAGKTTLLKIILGLLDPSEGSVRLFGTPRERFTQWGRIGYVPQHATRFEQGFPATVFEVVLMGRYGRRGLFRAVSAEDREAALRALSQVGLAGFERRRIGELSGGEQQRVFIARALAGEPDVLFLDEPTVGVEKDVKNDFYALLRRLNEEMKLTIVLITHDVESVAHEAMHVACLDCTLFFHDSVDRYFAESHKLVHPHAS